MPHSRYARRALVLSLLMAAPALAQPARDRITLDQYLD